MSSRPRVMYVDLAAGPDENDEFLAYVHGAILRLSMADIRAGMARGERSEEWKRDEERSA